MHCLVSVRAVLRLHTMAQSPPRDVLISYTIGTRVRVAARTHPGLVRDENQDFFALDPERTFMILADGMGGHSGGALASRLATHTVACCLEGNRDLASNTTNAVLREAFDQANEAIGDYANSHPDYARMGTTLICALLTNDERVAVAHVGDSRVYRLRDGVLRQMTRDHTLLSELQLQDLISERQAEQNLHLGHVLTRAVGTSGNGRPDFIGARLKRGDTFLLCSDGLYGVVEDDTLRTILLSSERMSLVTERLIQAALDGGAPDNVTVIVFTYQG